LLFRFEEMELLWALRKSIAPRRPQSHTEED
jgi:hypothetical protein